MLKLAYGIMKWMMTVEFKAILVVDVLTGNQLRIKDVFYHSILHRIHVIWNYYYIRVLKRFNAVYFSVLREAVLPSARILI